MFVTQARRRGAPHTGRTKYLFSERNAHVLRSATCVSVVLALAAGRAPEGALAQEGALPAGSGSVEVVPGQQYSRGWLHRLLLGNGYRDLWTQPVRVNMLDLNEFAGGLAPGCPGGGLQTATLRFQGTDGRQYVFRSVDKDPGAKLLPPFLRNTFVDELLQDHMSSAPPTAPLVAAPLLKAVGVLHADPELVMMPDDPALGPHRARFAGVLGHIEERPRDGPDGASGFAGSRRIEGTVHVWEKIEESPADRVDAQAFLTARLMDVFLGDWDRHYDQWRWARYPDGDGNIWQPIPRDRDNAFGRFDGVIAWFARSHVRQFVNFTESYPDIYGLTWTGRALDRRFFAELDKPTWDSIAHHIQARLTDEVIDDAVSRLRDDSTRVTATTLSRALKSRRGKLQDAANRYYRMLAREVDIHATDEADRVEIVRRSGSRVAVEIFGDSPATGDSRAERPPYFSRTFNPGETREIRVYLHGGNDSAVVRGDVRPEIVVRVIGGGGDDVFVDASGAQLNAQTWFYDARGNNTFEGSGAQVEGHRFQAPPRADVAAKSVPGSCGDSIPALPPRDLGDPFRDYGRQWFPIPWFSFQPDVGIVVGMGVQRVSYGFRRVPYASQMDLRAGFASGPDQFYVDYIGDSRDVIYGMDTSLEIRYSGVDISKFHGFGNETQLSGSGEFYRITQRKVSVDPSVTFFPSPHARLAIGPFLTATWTKLGQGNFIDSVRPYGTGQFAEAGIQGSFSFDTRNRSIAPTHGFHLTGGARYVPTLFQVTRIFGSAHAEAATYLTADIPMQPTLALRVAGKKVWGEAPFHESAFLGGGATIRGYSAQRFAGDAAAYANAELRLFLKHFSVGDVGIFGLADAGRVFLDGESSDQWHTAGGGGIWFALVNPGTAVSLAVASGERRLVYGQLGFMF